jgi:hypothetical protein
MAALVVAALMAGLSAHQAHPAHHAESESGAPEESGVAHQGSPLIDYLNAVGAANNAADPSATTIAALLSP